MVDIYVINTIYTLLAHTICIRYIHAINTIYIYAIKLYAINALCIRYILMKR